MILACGCRADGPAGCARSPARQIRVAARLVQHGGAAAGAYRILWRSCTGGMGSEGERDDDRLRRCVALRPSCPTGGLRPSVHPRPSPRARPDTNVLHATILTVDRTKVPTMASRLSRDFEPVLAESGHRLLGYYQTDPAPNNFPRLPVRTDTGFVWFTTSNRPARSGPTTLIPNDLPKVAKALGQFRVPVGPTFAWCPPLGRHSPRTLPR